MRILPLALIAIGVFGLLKHYGLIDPAVLHLLWPLLLIGIGVAMLVRGPRWRAARRERMRDHWERHMHRRFGPGWAELSEDERARFRAGMRQWRPRGGPWDGTCAPPAASDASAPKPPAGPPAPGQPG